MIYPSTILACKYAFYAFYHLFVLCTGVRMLMEDDDSPAVAMPIPSRTVPITHTKVKPKAKRDKLRGYRNNKALLCLLKDSANEGNSTSLTPTPARSTRGCVLSHHH